MRVGMALADPRLALELVLPSGRGCLLQRGPVLHVRLAQRKPQDLELLGQALAQQLQVQHAHAREEGLAWVRALLHPQAGVVLADGLQRLQQPLLLPPVEAAQLQQIGAAALPRRMRARVAFAARRLNARAGQLRVGQQELAPPLGHTLHRHRHEDKVTRTGSQHAVQLAPGPVRVELLRPQDLAGRVRLRGLPAHELQRLPRLQQPLQHPHVQQALAKFLPPADGPAQEVRLRGRELVHAAQRPDSQVLHHISSAIDGDEGLDNLLQRIHAQTTLGAARHERHHAARGRRALQRSIDLRPRHLPLVLHVRLHELVVRR
mmetsp:Transcript_26035/g.74655  ORF Transcript_26035/g.74655 Transcript_26035/m.74655 type:complete len:319 (+) Transcript_26035:680-1636(+)